jgi:hypothetical protein
MNFLIALTGARVLKKRTLILEAFCANDGIVQ